MSHRLLSLAALALLSCSGGDARLAMPDASGVVTARIRLAITAPGRHEAPLAVNARLLRFRDLDAESAHVLAGATTPSLDAVAEGQCVRVDPDRLLDDALAVTSPDSAVEMLDAGEIVVQAAGSTQRLVPRYLPEIMPFVFGVLYESDLPPTLVPIDLPPELGAGGEATVSAFGGEDVGSFDATIEVPAVPRLLSVGGRDPARLIPIDRLGSLPVRWVTARTAPDIIESVTITWTEGSGGALICRPARGQTGALLIGTRALETLPEGVDVQVAIERTVRQPLYAPGLDTAELEVTVRDVAAGRVQ